jgi:chromosome segregation ATPase
MTEEERQSAARWCTEAETNAASLMQESRRARAWHSEANFLLQEGSSEMEGECWMRVLEDREASGEHCLELESRLAEARSEYLETVQQAGTLTKDLNDAQSEIERLQQQGRVWERRRNLWEERCACCEGELEEARSELFSEDVSSRLVSTRANALTSIAEDAQAALSEYRAGLKAEKERRTEAERAVEDLRLKHDRWLLLLRDAAIDSTISPSLVAALQGGGEPEATEIIDSHLRALLARVALQSGDKCQYKVVSSQQLEPASGNPVCARGDEAGDASS